jgi:hypothetical protein
MIGGQNQLREATGSQPSTIRLRTFLTAMWTVIGVAVAVRLATGSEWWGAVALAVSALVVNAVLRANARRGEYRR